MKAEERPEWEREELAKKRDRVGNEEEKREGQGNRKMKNKERGR